MEHQITIKEEKGKIADRIAMRSSRPLLVDYATMCGTGYYGMNELEQYTFDYTHDELLRRLCREEELLICGTLDILGGIPSN